MLKEFITEQLTIATFVIKNFIGKILLRTI
jgi:hypothetical protein